jgi:hypothetical protein
MSRKKETRHLESRPWTTNIRALTSQTGTTTRRSLTWPDPAPSSPADPPSPQRRDDPDGEGQLTEDCRGRGPEFCSPVTEAGAPPAGLRRALWRERMWRPTESRTINGLDESRDEGFFCKEEDGWGALCENRISNVGVFLQNVGTDLEHLFYIKRSMCWFACFHRNMVFMGYFLLNK